MQLPKHWKWHLVIVLCILGSFITYSLIVPMYVQYKLNIFDVRQSVVHRMDVKENIVSFDMEVPPQFFLPNTINMPKVQAKVLYENRLWMELEIENIDFNLKNPRIVGEAKILKVDNTKAMNILMTNGWERKIRVEAIVKIFYFIPWYTLQVYKEIAIPLVEADVLSVYNAMPDYIFTKESQLEVYHMQNLTTILGELHHPIPEFEFTDYTIIKQTKSSLIMDLEVGFINPFLVKMQLSQISFDFVIQESVIANVIISDLHFAGSKVMLHLNIQFPIQDMLIIKNLVSELISRTLSNKYIDFKLSNLFISANIAYRNVDLSLPLGKWLQSINLNDILHRNIWNYLDFNVHNHDNQFLLNWHFHIPFIFKMVSTHFPYNIQFDISTIDKSKGFCSLNLRNVKIEMHSRQLSMSGEALIKFYDHKDAIRAASTLGNIFYDSQTFYIANIQLTKKNGSELAKRATDESKNWLELFQNTNIPLTLSKMNLDDILTSALHDFNTNTLQLDIQHQNNKFVVKFATNFQIPLNITLSHFNACLTISIFKSSVYACMNDISVKNGILTHGTATISNIKITPKSFSEILGCKSDCNVVLHNTTFGHSKRHTTFYKTQIPISFEIIKHHVSTHYEQLMQLLSKIDLVLGEVSIQNDKKDTNTFTGEAQMSISHPFLIKVHPMHLSLMFAINNIQFVSTSINLYIEHGQFVFKSKYSVSVVPHLQIAKYIPDLLQFNFNLLSLYSISVDKQPAYNLAMPLSSILSNFKSQITQLIQIPPFHPIINSMHISNTNHIINLNTQISTNYYPFVINLSKIQFQLNTQDNALVYVHINQIEFIHDHFTASLEIEFINPIELQSIWNGLLGSPVSDSISISKPQINDIDYFKSLTLNITPLFKLSTAMALFHMQLGHNLVSWLSLLQLELKQLTLIENKKTINGHLAAIINHLNILEIPNLTFDIHKMSFQVKQQNKVLFKGTSNLKYDNNHLLYIQYRVTNVNVLESPQFLSISNIHLSKLSLPMSLAIPFESSEMYPLFTNIGSTLSNLLLASKTDYIIPWSLGNFHLSNLHINSAKDILLTMSIQYIGPLVLDIQLDSVTIQLFTDNVPTGTVVGPLTLTNKKHEFKMLMQVEQVISINATNTISISTPVIRNQMIFPLTNLFLILYQFNDFIAQPYQATLSKTLDIQNSLFKIKLTKLHLDAKSLSIDAAININHPFHIIGSLNQAMFTIQTNCGRLVNIVVDDIQLKDNIMAFSKIHFKGLEGDCIKKTIHALLFNDIPGVYISNIELPKNDLSVLLNSNIQPLLKMVMDAVPHILEYMYYILEHMHISTILQQFKAGYLVLGNSDYNIKITNLKISQLSITGTYTLHTPMQMSIVLDNVISIKYKQDIIAVHAIITPNKFTLFIAKLPSTMISNLVHDVVHNQLESLVLYDVVINENGHAKTILLEIPMPLHFIFPLYDQLIHYHSRMKIFAHYSSIDVFISDLIKIRISEMSFNTNKQQIRISGESDFPLDLAISNLMVNMTIYDKLASVVCSIKMMNKLFTVSCDYKVEFDLLLNEIPTKDQLYAILDHIVLESISIFDNIIQLEVPMSQITKMMTINLRQDIIDLDRIDVNNMSIESIRNIWHQLYAMYQPKLKKLSIQNQNMKVSGEHQFTLANFVEMSALVEMGTNTCTALVKNTNEVELECKLTEISKIEKLRITIGTMHLTVTESFVISLINDLLNKADTVDTSGWFEKIKSYFNQYKHYLGYLRIGNDEINITGLPEYINIKIDQLHLAMDDLSISASIRTTSIIVITYSIQNMQSMLNRIQIKHHPVQSMEDVDIQSELLQIIGHYGDLSVKMPLEYISKINKWTQDTIASYKQDPTLLSTIRYYINKQLKALDSLNAKPKQDYLEVIIELDSPAPIQLALEMTVFGKLHGSDLAKGGLRIKTENDKIKIVAATYALDAAGEVLGHFSKLIFNHPDRMGQLDVTLEMFKNELNLSVPMQSYLDQFKQYNKKERIFGLKSVVVDPTEYGFVVDVVGYVHMMQMPLQMTLDKITCDFRYQTVHVIDLIITEVHSNDHEFRFHMEIHLRFPEFYEKWDLVLHRLITYVDIAIDSDITNIIVYSPTEEIRGFYDGVFSFEEIIFYKPIRVIPRPTGLSSGLVTVEFNNPGPLTINCGLLTVEMLNMKNKTLGVLSTRGVITLNNMHMMDGNNRMPLDIRLGSMWDWGNGIWSAIRGEIRIKANVTTPSGKEILWMNDVIEHSPETMIKHLWDIIWKMGRQLRLG